MNLYEGQTVALLYSMSWNRGKRSFHFRAGTRGTIAWAYWEGLVIDHLVLDLDLKGQPPYAHQFQGTWNVYIEDIRTLTDLERIAYATKED